MAFLFEKLEVYRKALNIAADVRVLCAPMGRGNYDLADQLRRASVSIAANIAEGNGRFHPGDKRRFLVIARASAYECIPLLDLCLRAEVITPEKVSYLRFGLEEICRMLGALIRKNSGEVEKREIEKQRIEK